MPAPIETIERSLHPRGMWVSRTDAFILASYDDDSNCVLERGKVFAAQRPGQGVALVAMTRFDDECGAVFVHGEKLWVVPASRTGATHRPLHILDSTHDGPPPAPVASLPMGYVNSLTVRADGTAWAAGDRVMFSDDGGTRWKNAEIQGYSDGFGAGFHEGKTGFFLHAQGLWVFERGLWEPVDTGGCNIRGVHGEWAVGSCEAKTAIGRIRARRVQWQPSERFTGSSGVSVHANGDRIRVLVSPDQSRAPGARRHAAIYESLDDGNTWKVAELPTFLSPATAPHIFTEEGVFLGIARRGDFWWMPL